MHSRILSALTAILLAATPTAILAQQDQPGKTKTLIYAIRGIKSMRRTRARTGGVRRLS